ncbi:MAG: glycosyltransferase family 2 protein [Anaerolineales bacterium]|nr:glycosyltransferase family 2 protein [Anaerolineales bacterium]
MKPTFTVVIPVFNEAESITEFHRRLRGMSRKAGDTWEFIYINDGSTDASPDLLRQFAQSDPCVRVIDFVRNFGHQIAVTAGLDSARGRAVIIIDADLQDPPEVIPELIARWREGNEVVFAVRAEREGETWIKELTAKVFYRLIFRITDIKIPLDTGDFRLLDEKVVAVMRQMRERHRFLRGMASWVGFRQVGVPYRRHARYAGKTKYPFSKMMRLALNAITSFSYFPLQLATYVGFVCATIAAISIPVVIVLRLTGSGAFFGQATTLISVLFLGGVQLICLGILGEYVGRIYDEVKGRPLYIVREEPRSMGKAAAGKKG